MMFKPLLFLGDNWYEKYALYNFDIGYHFANIFIWIGESFDPNILNYTGQIFWMFGITTMEYDGMEYVYEKTNYYPPIISFLYLTVIAVIFIVVAALYLKKRDISG
jgi:hypothetical protein